VRCNMTDSTSLPAFAAPAPPLKAAWLRCSRDKPWGVHRAFADGACTRCGWSAAEEPMPC